MIHNLLPTNIFLVLTKKNQHWKLKYVIDILNVIQNIFQQDIFLYNVDTFVQVTSDTRYSVIEWIDIIIRFLMNRMIRLTSMAFPVQRETECDSSSQLPLQSKRTPRMYMLLS